MPSRTRGPGALIALVPLFTAGYLAPYLLPTVVGRLSAGLGLTPAQAGLVGSVLLLGSSTAGTAFRATTTPRATPTSVSPDSRSSSRGSA